MSSRTYAEAGVDTAAGDRAVELMKSAVRATHGPEVLGGVGGFAGLFDASALLGYRRPLLASSTENLTEDEPQLITSTTGNSIII